jgi:hypothetical protein
VGIFIVFFLNPTEEKVILSPFSTAIEKTPSLLVMVPRPFSSTITLAEGIPRKLSAVITTPYNCITESFIEGILCALALTVNANIKNGKRMREYFFIN